MLHYTVKGEGVPLLLIHGFPNDSSAWDKIVPALAENYRVILPDLPGAGKTPLYGGELTLEYMASCLKEILDHENIPEAVIAGHSMGGYTALQFAAMYPQRVRGLSLVHSLASPDTEEKKENRRKAIALMRKGEAEKEMFLRGMAQNLFAEAFANQHPEVVRSVAEKGNQLSAEALTAFYQAIMNRSDKRQLLSGFYFPIQWIVGDEDSATPMKDALEQCHVAAVNDICLYSPCGHMSFLEMPDRLISDLERFLQYCYTPPVPRG